MCKIESGIVLGGFKTERGGTFLDVAGLREVKTSVWIRHNTYRVPVWQSSLPGLSYNECRAVVTAGAHRGSACLLLKPLEQALPPGLKT